MKAKLRLFLDTIEHPEKYDWSFFDDLFCLIGKGTVGLVLTYIIMVACLLIHA